MGLVGWLDVLCLMFEVDEENTLITRMDVSGEEKRC